MAYSDIWSQIRYLAPYNYILDSNIVEFDIEKANINVLLYYGAINKTTYDQLNALPKIVFKLDGKLILSIPLQPINADIPIVSVPSGIIKSVTSSPSTINECELSSIQ